MKTTSIQIQQNTKNTIRFELPTYLQTAPNALLTKAETVSYICFKINVKKIKYRKIHIIITTVGCGLCHLRRLVHGSTELISGAVLTPELWIIYPKISQFHLEGN